MTSDIKRLYRSRENRMIGGVCSGLGEYFTIDPTLVRLLFILFALTGGSGLLAYLIMLLVIPEKPWESETDAPVEDDKTDQRNNNPFEVGRTMIAHEELSWAMTLMNRQPFDPVMDFQADKRIQK